MPHKRSLLGVALEAPGFDFSVPSELRGWLLGGGQVQRGLHALLDLFRERGLLQARGPWWSPAGARGRGRRSGGRGVQLVIES